MADDQGRRTGEGKAETNNQRARENGGGDSGGSKSPSDSDRLRERVKDDAAKSLNRK